LDFEVREQQRDQHPRPGENAAPDEQLAVGLVGLRLDGAQPVSDAGVAHFGIAHEGLLDPVQRFLDG
jgi:hypothetical protein